MSFTPVIFQRKTEYKLAQRALIYVLIIALILITTRGLFLLPENTLTLAISQMKSEPKGFPEGEGIKKNFRKAGSQKNSQKVRASDFLPLLCQFIGMGVSPVFAQEGKRFSDRVPYSGKIKTIPCRHLFNITGIDGKNFNQPSAVDVFKDRVIVLDGINGRVAVFKTDGTPLFYFGKKGQEPGEFKSPLGLTVDTRGRIYVADTGNHRIQIFDPNGRHLSSFKLAPWGQAYNLPENSQKNGNSYATKLKEEGYGFPSDPTDLVLDEKNKRLFIVDNDNHRIIVYTLDGKFVKEIGEVGFENGQFRYPYSIVIDKKGMFYVVDVLNTRVQVFNNEGLFVRNIGEWGIEKGQFFRPQGIAIDNKGRIFVTESYQKIGVIQAFTEDGTFLAILGDKSRKKLSFSVPADISFDEQNRIYICEMYDSRISVYQIED